MWSSHAENEVFLQRPSKAASLCTLLSKALWGVWREGKGLTQKAQLSPLFVPWELTMWNLILLYGGRAAFQSQYGSFITHFMNKSLRKCLQLWVQHCKLEW